MARAFKFIGAFLITTLIIFGSVLFLNWKPFTIFFENRDAMTEGSEWVEKTYSLRGLTQYIGTNPEYVSLVSNVITANDSTISYEPHVQRPMGTTANIFLLIAAADAIENGELDKDQKLNWDSVSKYQIPGVNESEHEQSYRAADSRGWIDSDRQISLGRALHLLPEFNDLALADYLWWMIGSHKWTEITEKLKVEQTELPLPFSGLYLTISPGIRQMETSEILETDLSKSQTLFRKQVIEYSERFIADTVFRDSVQKYTLSNRLGNTFMEERDALALFPKTTAAEITRILTDLSNNLLISERVSTQVKDWMRWPMERQSGIHRDFSDYGAIYDNRMGLLTGLDFGTSIYTGDTTVQAVFFDRIQIAFWFHMSSNHMHQDFQQRLIFDPALIQQVKRFTEIQPPDNSAGLSN